MHLCREAVGNCLVGASGNLNGVALAGEIAKDLRLSCNFLDQRATDNGDANRSGLIVDHGQTRLGGLAVDELDAEDLRLRERDGDGDVEIGSLRLVYCLLLSLRTR